MEGLRDALVRLSHVVGELNAERDPRHLLDLIAQSAAELVGADAASVVVVEGAEARCAAVHGLPSSYIGTQAPPGQGTIWGVIERRETMDVKSLDPGFVNSAGVRLRSGVAVPGVVRDRVIGALYVLWFDEARASTPEEREVLVLLAGHAVVALEKAAAFEREEARRRADEEAKNLFVAMTGHELKTPVTVIGGFAATLLHRWDELGEERRREALEAIVRRTESLARLIDRLLLVSRADAGSLRIAPEPLDLRPLVKLAAAGFDDLSERHSIVVDLPSSLPHVVADPQAVETVLGQLLENAFKYSPDGGTVEVRAEARDGVVEVSVSDEGVGLAGVDVERIFDRFVQSDPSDTRRFGGVGLGLYIVRRLVEAQGGAVRATAREGGGSTVAFTLPGAP